MSLDGVHMNEFTGDIDNQVIFVMGSIVNLECPVLLVLKL